MANGPQGDAALTPAVAATSKPVDVAPQGIAGESPASIVLRMRQAQIRKFEQESIGAQWLLRIAHRTFG